MCQELGTEKLNFQKAQISYPAIPSRVETNPIMTYRLK